jgi:hypothetical protein
LFDIYKEKCLIALFIHGGVLVMSLPSTVLQEKFRCAFAAMKQVNHEISLLNSTHPLLKRDVPLEDATRVADEVAQGICGFVQTFMAASAESLVKGAQLLPAGLSSEAEEICRPIAEIALRDFERYFAELSKDQLASEAVSHASGPSDTPASNVRLG